jgi:hypothetical protein
MARYSTFPTTIEDTLTFRLKSLSENGNNYLKIQGRQTGVTRWVQNGQETSKLRFTVSNNDFDTFIEFDYTYNGTPIKYKVHLTNILSNLGKGKIWYFICPQTDKLCRKLYLNGGYFVHRTAFNGLMYDKQIQSKSFRSMYALFKNSFEYESISDEINKKYFKTHYSGKPTKRYKYLVSKLNYYS